MPNGNIPPFNEIARNFDPMMPQAAFNQIRDKYFQDVVAPRLEFKYRATAYEEFKKLTERPKMLTGSERMLMRAGLVATSGAKELVAPFKDFVPQARKAFEKFKADEEAMVKVAEREGIGTTGLRVIGTLTGATLPIVASFAGAAPVAQALVARTTLQGRNFELANRMLRGGLAFSAYEAAREEHGNKMVAGIKGFGIGATFEAGAFTLVRFLKSRGIGNAEQVARDALGGKGVPPEADSLIAEKITTDAQTIKQELRVEFIQETPNKRGARAVVMNEIGTRVNVPIESFKESEAVEQVQAIINKGGVRSIGIEYNPDHFSQMQEFLRGAGGLLDGKYQKPVLVKVQPGMAERVAAKSTREGIPAEAISEDTVRMELLRVDGQVPPTPTQAAEIPREPTIIGGPSEEEIGRVLRAYRTPSGGTMNPAAESFARSMVKKVWDPNVNPASKTTAVRMLQRQFPDLLPPGLNPKSHGIVKSPVEAAAEKSTRKPVEEMISELKTFSEKARVIGEKVSSREITPDEGRELLRKARPEFTQAEPLSESRVMEILKEAGVNPADADIDYLKSIGEAEIRRALDVVQSGRVAGATPGPASVFQDKMPRGEKTQFGADIAGRKPIRESLEEGGIGRLVENIIREEGPEKLTIRPHRAGLILPSDVIADQIAPGEKIFGLTFQDIRPTLKKLGIELPPGTNEKALPLIMMSRPIEKPHLYHELLHSNMFGSGVEAQMVIPEGSRETVMHIVSGLKRTGAYRNMSFKNVLNEAFIFPAQAIRSGDERLLQTVIDLDIDKAHIFRLVNGTAQNILDHTFTKIDSITGRHLQRQMRDLVRRTSENVSYELDGVVGHAAYYDPARSKWIVQGSQGEHVFNDVNGAYDFLYALDRQDMIPSWTFGAEIRGVRGPFLPPGSHDPTGKRPLPDLPPDKKTFGMTSISGWFRPTLPWVATVHRKVNAVFGRKATYLPLFERVKAVDDAVFKFDQVVLGEGGRVPKFMEHFGPIPKKKMNDYFEWMTHPSNERQGLQEALKLTDKDVSQLAGIENFIKEIDADTGIGIMWYLRQNFPKLRAFNFISDHVWGTHIDPKTTNFWERAVRIEGTLDPKDTNLARLVNFGMTAGYKKKMFEEPLAELAKLVDLQGKDGRYILGPVRMPLKNYVNYVSGLPDFTQSALRAAGSAFESTLEKAIQNANKHLPTGSKLPVGYKLPKALMNKMLVLSYAAGLGLRPAVVARDSFWVFLSTLPILGPVRFGRALSRGLSSKGWKAAQDAGALLHKSNIGGNYGDILQEIPVGEGGMFDRAVRLSQTLLGPARWGNNFARTITWNGEYHDAISAIRRYRTGEISAGELIHRKNTSLWYNDPPVISNLVERAGDKSVPVEYVAREFAQQLVDITQWPYRRGTQPALLRTGVGRIFGQYGTWPMNFLDMINRHTRKMADSNFRPAAIESLAWWGALNYAGASAMNAIGADQDHWFGISPAGYGGGPHLEFVMALMQAPEETPRGLEARRTIAEYYLDFIPASVEIRGILRALEKDEDFWSKGILPGPGLIRALGFRPINEMEKDKDFVEWLQEEAGFGPGGRRY